MFNHQIQNQKLFASFFFKISFSPWGFIFLCFHLNIFAQNPPDSITPQYNVDELIISDTKISKKKTNHRTEASQTALPQDDRFRTPESSPGVELYTAKDIENIRPNDVYNLFERALGMTITRQGSRIHNWVSGRGGDKSALGIILDGVYIPATAAQRVLGDIPVEMIESVRIVRDASIMTMGPVFSPGSSKAGSANQGFIIITTKRYSKEDRKMNQISGGYGTYSTLKLNGFHRSSIQDIAYIGLGYAKTRNSTKTDRNGDWNSAYDGNTFLSNAGLFAQGPISADLMIFYNQAKRDIQRYQQEDGTFNSAYWTYDPVNTRIAAIDITGKWTENQITHLSGGYADAIGTGYYDSMDSNKIITLAAGEKFKDRAIEANLLHTWILDKASLSNALKAGAQIVMWYQRTEGSNSGNKENIYGFYTSDELELSDQLTFDVGFRLDKRLIVEGGETYIADSTTAQLPDHIWGGDAYSFALGGGYHFSDDYNLTARFAFNNTPTSRLLSTIHHKDLAAEKRLKYELGTQTIFLTQLGLTATAYYYDIRNSKEQAVDERGKGLIILSSDGDEITVYDATGHIKRYGFELSVFGSAIGPLGYSIGYSLFKCDSTDLDKKNPRYKFTMELNYNHKGFHASLSTLKVPQYTGNNQMSVGNYLVFNASASQQINPNLRISFYGKNITNEKYTTNYKSMRGSSSGYYYDIGALYGIEGSLAF